MKAQYRRVIAATLATTTLASVAHVVDTSVNVFEAQTAHADEIKDIVIQDAYFVTGDGDRVSGNTTRESMMAVTDFVMNFVVPAGAKPGDTARFRFNSSYANNEFDFGPGIQTNVINPLRIENPASTRVVVKDDNDVVIAIVSTIGSFFTLEFTDAISNYAGGQVRQLRLPVKVDGKSYTSLQSKDVTQITSKVQNVTSIANIEYVTNNQMKEISRYTNEERVTLIPWRIDRRNVSDYFNSAMRMSAWLDEKLYAVNIPGSESNSVRVGFAPQNITSDTTFSFQLPEGATPIDPARMRWNLDEISYRPYSVAKQNDRGLYGYTQYDAVDSGDASKPGVFEFSYDPATRTYTGTVKGKKPGVAYYLMLYPFFTIPITSQDDYRDEIEVKFISGTSREYYIQNDVAPGDSNEFGSTSPYIRSTLVTGRLGEGNFDGNPIDVDFDVDVFVEDARVDELDVTGKTSTGENSLATSANDAVFVNDGEANYVLRIKNNSNVALSAPRVTLPNGEVVQFERPDSGKNKRWASAVVGDLGSKIPPGGVGYLVVPAEDVPWGTQPTEKDFTVSYQYGLDPDNTQTASTWISRKLADAYVVDAFNDGREVVIQVGTAEDGVLETFRFGLGDSITNITYDKATNTLVVQDANGGKNRIALNTTRLTPGDNNTVVLTGRDGQGNTHSVELVDNVRVNAELTNARTQIQQIIEKYNREITSLQREVETQTALLKQREGDAQRAADAAARAQSHVRDVEIALQNVIIRDQQTTQLQLQNARQRVSDAQQAAQRAQHVVDQTNRELAQFERDIEALRSRVDVQVQTYDELVENYNARESHLRELEQRERTLTTTIMDLRRQINTASDNQAANEANTQKLQAELDDVMQQVRDNRAAFDAEVKKTQRERDELAQRATRAEGDITSINSDIAEINERLVALNAAIAAAQKDADAALAASITSGNRNPDNTIDLNRKDESNITVPEAHKRGLEKCATGVGGAVLVGLPVVLLAATAAAQSNLPGIDAQIARAQRELGVFNPEVAAFIRNNAGAIGATLTAATLIGLLTVPGLCGDQSVIGAIKESAARK